MGQSLNASAAVVAVELAAQSGAGLRTQDAAGHLTDDGFR